MEFDGTSGEEFLCENVSWIFGLATVLTPRRADAEDVAQEVLVRALRNVGRIQGAKSPKAYLRRMVVNEVIRFEKRSRRNSGVALIDEAVDEPGYARADLQADTGRLLSGLGRREAAAVALYYLDQCSYAEIASALRCREGTARSLVSRGLAHLRESHIGAASSSLAVRGTRERSREQ